MSFKEYRQYDALGLAELIRNKQVTAEEVLEAAIARYEAVNGRINAVNTPLFDLARQMLNQADPNAPFAGVPLLIKDLNIPVKGTLMKDGNRAFGQRVSQYDSYFAQKLRTGGFAFLGKSNTPEFGLTPYTEPIEAGPTRSPWNLARTAGGSSGGSGAGVAAGIVPIATASDGGGSIRIPAHHNGLVGLKTTRGRISLGPDYGENWAGAVVENCVSRSVRDSAAFLDAMHGDFPGELHITRAPEQSFSAAAGKDPGKLRIAVSTKHALAKPVDTQTIEAIDQTVALLTSLGHQVEEIELPYTQQDLVNNFIPIIAGESGAIVQSISKYLGRPAKPSDMEPNTFTLGLLGLAMSAQDYAMALQGWNDLARRMGQLHQTYDLLLTPVTALHSFTIGDLHASKAEERLVNIINRFKLKGLVKASVDQLADKVFTYMAYTPIANMTGQPAISLPLHWTADNIPVGSMFTAAIGRDDLLFSLAGQLEKAKPWMGKYAEIE